MKFRHEYKYSVNEADLMILRNRLPLILEADPHAINGVYMIRSIYFDNPSDRALREKIDGGNFREKFRIRYYNNDLSIIKLEKKSKIHGLCNKESVRITAEEAQKIVDGDLLWMLDSDRALCKELYAKMNYQLIRPKTIVDYTREPFIFGPGNVRVTLDYNIRTGLLDTDFLNSKTVTLPAGNRFGLLEVKGDDYLPDIVKRAVYLPGRRENAFSKYAQCRMYE